MGNRDRKRLRRIRDEVICRDGYVCCYCGVELNQQTVTMEHIVPDSRRGTYNTTNLTVACGACNNKRGDLPFFEFIKRFSVSEQKIQKYKHLYIGNLKIKVLNIAKEEILKEFQNEDYVPIQLIEKACKVLNIRMVDFSFYEKTYELGFSFYEPLPHKRIKFYFEQLIKIIESDPR